MCLRCCLRRTDSSSNVNQDSTNQQSSWSTNSQWRASGESVKSESIDSQPKSLLFTCFSSDEGAASKDVSVGNVLQRVKLAKRSKKDGKECTFEEKKRYLEKAHRTMGLLPNTALVDRYAKRAQMLERTQTVTECPENHRKGDILFSLPVTKLTTVAAKPTADEMTRKPRLMSDEVADNDELNEEDDLREVDVDDKNYMFHDREIAFACRDMMAQIGNVDILAEAGMVEKRVFFYRWNPFALIEELAARKCFDCFGLRKNTFISNSAAMPTENERKNRTKEKRASKGKFEDAVKDLESNNVPAVSPSLSCAATLSSQMSYTQLSGELNRTGRSRRPVIKKKVPASSKARSGSKSRCGRIKDQRSFMMDTTKESSSRL